MRLRLIQVATVATALGAVVACRSDSTTSPEPGRSISARQAGGGDNVLVVDNDLADCKNADFTSIQAAVAAAEPGSKILVCAGTYRETVTLPSPKSGLRLQAKGEPGEVVLDGSNALQIGFLLEGVTGVLVEGFTVKRYVHADIELVGGGQNTIRKNMTTETQEGISLRNSSGNVVEHNTSFANVGSCRTFMGLPGSCGILVSEGSASNVIRHNTLFENGFGVMLDDASTGNVVFHNEVHDNVLPGIFNRSSDGTVIEDNRSFGNLAGIRVAGITRPVTGVTVRNNRLARNRNNGIVLNVANGNLVEQNHTEENGLAGIALNTANENRVEKNRSEENAFEGIRLINAQANVIRDNTSERNVLDGIKAYSTSGGNTIERNLMRDNKEHDAHDDSVGPGTAGTANFWLKNHCETENRPGLCEHTPGGPAKN